MRLYTWLCITVYSYIRIYTYVIVPYIFQHRSLCLLLKVRYWLFYVCGVNKTSSELSLTKTKINEYINEILNTEQ